MAGNSRCVIVAGWRKDLLKFDGSLDSQLDDKLDGQLDGKIDGRLYGTLDGNTIYISSRCTSGGCLPPPADPSRD